MKDSPAKLADTRARITQLESEKTRLEAFSSVCFRIRTIADAELPDARGVAKQLAEDLEDASSRSDGVIGVGVKRIRFYINSHDPVDSCRACTTPRTYSDRHRHPTSR